MCLLRQSLYMLNWPISCDTRRQKKAIETKRPEDSDAFSRSGTQTLNSCRSLDYACANKSIIYVSLIYVGAIEKYIYVSTNLRVAPQQSTKMQQIEGYKRTRKPVNVLRHCRASTLTPEIILPIAVPLQKIPFL